MTENTTIDKPQTNEVQANHQIIYKTSKLTSLLAFLSFCGVCGIVYYGAFSPLGLIKQKEVNNSQQQAILLLQEENRSLIKQLSSIQDEQNRLNTKIMALNPSQTDLILTQLNSLLNGANQSVIIYHDYAGAIQLLKSAEQVLVTSNDPVFNNLKVALTADLDSLMTQNNADYAVKQSQLSVLSDAILSLKYNQVYQHQDAAVTATAWQKFVNNVKQSIIGLVKIKEVNPDFKDQLNLPDDVSLLTQRLKLNVLNLQQTFILHNQQEWNLNLEQIDYIVNHYYINDINAKKVLTITAQLREINFSNNSVSLDKSISALSKTIQLHSGK